MSENESTWQNYEEVAAFLLNRWADYFELNISNVEGKQQVKGKRSGTDWEIDAKAVCKDGESFLIVECRKYKKAKQKQAQVAGLAYEILDTGAAGGIIVSPLGLQKGAELIAKAEKIHKILLTPESTTQDYLMKFMEKTFMGFSSTVAISDFVIVRTFNSDKEMREYGKMRKEEAERSNREAYELRRKNIK